MAPFLRSIAPGGYYSNYHSDLDPNGYFKSCDQYHWILQRSIRGVLEQPVVHCTYLIRADVIEDLTYEDDTNRYEYVVFSDSARKAGVVQYLDNRQVYGYITFDEGADNHVPGGIDKARVLLKMAPAQPPRTGSAVLGTRVTAPAKRRLFACFGLQRSGSTWMFNLVREICQAAGIDHVSRYRESVDNLRWDEVGDRLMISKSHSQWGNYIPFFAENDAKGVITVRDPRDAVASLMQRRLEGRERGFDRAMADVAHSAWRQLVFARELALPVFRYEDGFVGRPETFNKISTLLGVTLPDARRDEILAKLAPEAVRGIVRTLEKAAESIGQQVWQHDTDKLTDVALAPGIERLIEGQWHRDHIGDGRTGKYRDVLTAEQEALIMECTADFRAHFGYDTVD